MLRILKLLERKTMGSIALAVFVLFLPLLSFGQNTVTGVVTDYQEDYGLPGATVSIKGTSQGTITDMNGGYTINASPTDTLIFSFVGYQTQVIPVGNRSQIDIALNIEMSELEEIVVIGYGSQQKKVATGSISKVDAKNLEGFKVADVTSALDGQVSGVIVSEASGQPGSGKNILIRGVSTNGDNSPLFIVDGMTVDNINNINPNDIESVDVLKDAASTAIYGSRAANGVVIVTTKKGSKGDGTITYEFFTSLSQPWKIPEMLNANEYIDITREKFENGGQLSSLDALGFPQVGDQTENTDWMEEIFDNASVVNHRLSAQMPNAFLSVEYWDQNGVIGGEKSNYKRYALRFNADKEINDYIKVGNNIYINRVENQNIGTNNAFGTVIADAFSYDPITPVRDENGEFGFAQSEWVQKEYINPLSRLFIQDNDGHSDQIQGNVFLEFEPLEGLVFHSDFGADLNWFNFRTFTPSYNFHSAFFNVNNSVVQGYGHSQTLQLENYVKYEKKFDDHNLNVVVGHTYLSRAFEQAGGSTLNIPEAAQFQDNFQYVDAGQDTSDLAYGIAAVDQRLISFFGRVLYNYQGKYLFSATLRRDGSTQFGPQSRFGFFPSASVGWVISDESFFPSGGAMSFLKIRTSWGRNGNDRITPLGYTARVVNAFSYALGQDQALNRGAALATLPNPNIKWEESDQIDIGIESKFFDDRLSTEISLYQKRTIDLLGREQVPGTFGVTDFPLSNLGEIRNRGIEAAVSFQQNFGELNLNTTLNYTTFRNEVIEVPGTATFLNGYNWPVRNTPISRMTEGEPVGHFVGYRTLGIFQSREDVFAHINSQGDPLQPDAAPGDLIFDDVNGDGQINSDDITDIGSPWPDHIFGLTIRADYKGFDFSAIFATQIGHDIYRTYERQDITFTNYQSFWLDRWTPENPSEEYPRLVSNDPNNNQRPSDFYVEDGSFLRLRNLQFGYNLPPGLLERAKLSSVRIYLSANNLFTLTNYTGFDPEIGTNGWILDTGIDKGYYPSNRTLGAGIIISM